MNVLDPVFNDLSCEPPAKDRFTASALMVTFTHLLRMCADYGLGCSLRTTIEFHSLLLAEGYSIYDWLFDRSSPEVERHFLLVLATKSPLIAGLDTAICDSVQASEASCKFGKSESLLVAYLLNVPLISLSSDRWCVPHPECTISQLNDDGDLETTVALLCNIAAESHFQNHAAWIQRRLRESFTDLLDLWEHRDEAFPNIEFCSSVRDQLYALTDSSGLSILVADRLFDIQRVAELGEAGDVSSFRTKCSPSTKATLDKYRSSYEFRDSSGCVRTCGWHLYLPDGNRIYFVRSDSCYFVGYVGKHLPTMKYP